MIDGRPAGDLRELKDLAASEFARGRFDRAATLYSALALGRCNLEEFVLV